MNNSRGVVVAGDGSGRGDTVVVGAAAATAATVAAAAVSQHGSDGIG